MSIPVDIRRLLDSMNSVMAEVTTQVKETQAVKRRLATMEAEIIKLKGEASSLADHGHRLANRYYVLHEELMSLLEAHFPEEAAMAGAKVPPAPPTIPNEAVTRPLKPTRPAPRPTKPVK